MDNNVEKEDTANKKKLASSRGHKKTTTVTKPSNTTKKPQQPKAKSGKVLPPAAEETIDLTNDDDNEVIDNASKISKRTPKFGSESMGNHSQVKVSPSVYLHRATPYLCGHVSRLDKARKMSTNCEIARKQPVTLHVGGRLQQFPSSSVVDNNHHSIPQTLPKTQIPRPYVNRNNNGHEHAAPTTGFHRHFMDHPSEKSVLGAIFVNNLLQQSILEYQKLRSGAYPNLAPQHRMAHINHNSASSRHNPTCPGHKTVIPSNARVPLTNSAITKSVTSTFTAPSASSVSTTSRDNVRSSSAEYPRISSTYQTVKLQRAQNRSPDQIPKPKQQLAASKLKACSPFVSVTPIHCSINNSKNARSSSVNNDKSSETLGEISSCLTINSNASTNTSTHQCEQVSYATLQEVSVKESFPNYDTPPIATPFNASILSDTMETTCSIGNDDISTASTSTTGVNPFDILSSGSEQYTVNRPSKRIVTFPDIAEQASAPKTQKCHHYWRSPILARRQRIGSSKRSMRAALRSAVRKLSAHTTRTSVGTTGVKQVVLTADHQYIPVANHMSLASISAMSTPFIAPMTTTPPSTTTPLQQICRYYRCQSVSHPNSVLGMIRTCHMCHTNYTIACGNITNGRCSINLNVIECPRCWNSNACYCGEPFSDRCVAAREM